MHVACGKKYKGFPATFDNDALVRSYNNDSTNAKHWTALIINLLLFNVPWITFQRNASNTKQGMLHSLVIDNHMVTMHVKNT